MLRTFKIAIFAIFIAIASLASIGPGDSRAGAAESVGGWVLHSDGAVSSIGEAPVYGQATGHSSPAVAIVATPSGLGYYIALADGTILPFGDAARLGDVSWIDLDEPIVGMDAATDG
ncbi:MAG: hypothetical protein GY773_09930, partial [Actinomycetia bacterium]|nr:hypothetical protein [Actinomycetes bacterium]